jgi:CheY-like chemotaxis protein
MKEKILWIEDDKELLDVSIPLYSDYLNISISGATSGDEGIKELKKNGKDYSLVLLDLEMPGKDGVDTYEEIKKIDESLPVIWCSAHLGEPNWEARIAPYNWLKRIEKPLPMTTSSDFQKDVVDIIISERKKYLNQFFDNTKKEHKNDNLVLNPFDYKFDEFLISDENEIDKIYDKASEMSADFVDIFFKSNPDVDWIVIARDPSNIIKFGIKGKELLHKDLMNLAKKLDSIVFTYSRPKVIEQIDKSKTKTPNNCHWSYKEETNDYYPTVKIKVDVDKIFYCDFDTGSTHSFLSYEDLRKIGALERLYFFSESSILWGDSYRYANYELLCELLSRSGKRKITLRCEVVKSWRSSPQHKNYKGRIGLVGRNLLLENKIKLILDGEKKETDIK